MNTPRPIHFIVTEDRVELIENIQNQLQTILKDQTIETEVVPYTFFKDGSPETQLKQSVRGKHVYIMSDVYSNAKNKEGFCPSVNDRYFYSRCLQRIAKVFGAKTINVLFPAFPYARDDKFDNNGAKENIKRKPNAANMIVEDCIKLKIDYVITHDIHNNATISSAPNMIGLGFGRLIEEVMKRAGINQKNIILSGTDQGATKKIEELCKDLHINYLEASKKRDYSKPQSVSKIKVNGTVSKKDVLLYDDILDTGATLITCLKEIWKKRGKPRSVNLLISHGLFNGDSLQQLLEAHKAGLFNKLFITNSVLRTQLETFFEENNYPSFIETIDISTIITHTIASIAQEKDINYNNNTPILATV